MRVPRAIIAALLGAAPLGSAGAPSRPPADRFAGDTAGLTPFVGTWTGEGQGLGAQIRDSLVFSVALGGKALRFSMISRSGDGFLAEGFLWSTGAEHQIQLVEFSTVAPFRRLLGTGEPGALALDELPPERHTRVRLDLSADGVLRLRELNTEVDPPRAFVDESFTRVGP